MRPDDTAAAHEQELRDALARQLESDSHDRGLIVERLSWTPEERLRANTAFIRFVLSLRPDGPVIRED